MQNAKHAYIEFHSQVEELEKQWSREHHLVAKGGVELLSIEKEDFFYLTKVNEGRWIRLGRMLSFN